MPNLKANQIEKRIAIGNIIKDITNLFRLEKKKDNGIKNKALRDIRTLFETGEDYYKPKKLLMLLMIIILNMKLMVIKTNAIH